MRRSFGRVPVNRLWPNGFNEREAEHQSLRLLAELERELLGFNRLPAKCPRRRLVGLAAVESNRDAVDGEGKAERLVDQGQPVVGAMLDGAAEALPVEGVGAASD